MEVNNDPEICFAIIQLKYDTTPNTLMTKLYRKIQNQPMSPYDPQKGLPFGCSVSQADKDNGSPRVGI